MTDRRLVENFAELGVGTRVIVTPCGYCGGEHKGMALRLVDGAGADVTGLIQFAVMYEVVPFMPCMPSSPWGVCAEMVERKLVYEQVDPSAARARTTKRGKEIIR